MIYFEYLQEKGFFILSQIGQRVGLGNFAVFLQIPKSAFLFGG